MREGGWKGGWSEGGREERERIEEGVKERGIRYEEAWLTQHQVSM